LGAGRQEKFIVSQRDRLPRVKTFLPLGGTIDYEARALERPAAWVTDFGLECLSIGERATTAVASVPLHQPPVIWHLARQRLGLYRNPFSDPDPPGGADRLHSLSRTGRAPQIRSQSNAAGLPRGATLETRTSDEFHPLCIEGGGG
jgi:hypothetical protein